MELLEDFDFGLECHPGKEDVVIGASNRKSLLMSVLVMQELDLLVRFRDKSLVCEEFSFEDKLGMLKLSCRIFDEF